ncbi:MAG: YbaB/EbfC family nucleoid-associated protein [Deltaproteobacteria bacterium]|uniref:Nucleoid-associated protein JW984_06955 n=1 Tax=Candidatus Zymogenus saltonus TaxID=2844893 RepID=A0A9D8KEC8_9DELT|nr:YbaB/EbfC family nucleoid-associated protein [Candidatus Zymogenus saltonus]
MSRQGGGGFGDIMKQAQKMQQDMMRIQEEMASKTIEASSGGGMVTVVVNGRQELLSITIEKDIVDPADVEMLQDLVLAAVNEGLLKSQEMVKEEMLKITGGINIPGLNL